jgi:hypothetical protein
MLPSMVVPASYCKGKEIPPQHSVPKLYSFFQADVAMNVLTMA